MVQKKILKSFHPKNHSLILVFFYNFPVYDILGFLR